MPKHKAISTAGNLSALATLSRLYFCIGFLFNITHLHKYIFTKVNINIYISTILK